jgi:hypothetical protein
MSLGLGVFLDDLVSVIADSLSSISLSPDVTTSNPIPSSGFATFWPLPAKTPAAAPETYPAGLRALPRR